jgi:hypothetical protein
MKGGVYRLSTLLVLSALLFGGCERSDEAVSVGEQAMPAPGAALADVEELQWDALIPPDYRPEELFSEDLSELEDDDPRALAMMDKLKALWAEAPVVEALDGMTVKLPGFVAPLQMDGEYISEFLLAPYYGACIHVPPPPANQTVYVITEEGRGVKHKLFDAVWVVGVLSVKRFNSEVGDAGYTLYANEVVPFDG